MIGSARGIMDYYGGKLSCPLTGVSLFVPVGAIPEGIRQEIYFQVCQDGSHIEKINGQLLSPIVICGPHGLQFEKPVELTLPHSAGNTAHHLSLTLHGTTQSKLSKFYCDFVRQRKHLFRWQNKWPTIKQIVHDEWNSPCYEFECFCSRRSFLVHLFMLIFVQQMSP